MYLSCCRVLGLLSKLVTSPFWRIVECCTHILDLNDHYVRLHEYLSDNATSTEPTVLKGESPFEGQMIMRDKMLDSLLENAPEDDVAVQV